MKRALNETVIRGIKTSIPFHVVMMEHPRFITGDYDTTFIDKVLGKIQYKKQHHEIAAIAVAIGKILREQYVTTAQTKKQTRISQWKLAGRQALMKRL
jgi:acetyl/propionyl-CoA carboxylase alpha subunit